MDKPPPGRRTQQRRSRTGCLPCRRQKIKCDETQPSCNQCCKRGRACNISSSRFRVYNGGAEASTALDCPPPAPASSNGSARSSDRRLSQSTDRRFSHSSFADDTSTMDLDMSRNGANTSSPVSNAAYDSGRILLQLAQVPVPVAEPPTGATMMPSPSSCCSSDFFAGSAAAASASAASASAPVPAHAPLSATLDSTLSPSSPHADDGLAHLPPLTGISHTPNYSTESPRTSVSFPELSTTTTIPEIDVDDALTDPELSFFLRHFSDTMGNWMDLFDLDCSYYRQVPMMARSSPLLLYSACAVAAKQLDLVKAHARPLLHQSQVQSWQYGPHKDFAWYSTKYYDAAISRLLERVSDLSKGGPGHGGEAAHGSPGHGEPEPTRSCGNSIVVASTILSVYEFLSASGQTWSEHLDGIRSFIHLSDEAWFFNFQSLSASTLVIEPLPPNLIRAAFWNFARQDFLAALINCDKTRLDTENPAIWRRMGLSVDGEGRFVALTDTTPGNPYERESPYMRADVLSNTLVWLLSKLANYTAMFMESKKTSPSAERTVSAERLEAIWLELGRQFEAWRQSLPTSFRACYRVKNARPCRHHPGSLIQHETWYTTSMCASSMQSYHMGQILLLIHKPQGLVAPAGPGPGPSAADALTSFRQMNKVLQHHSAEIGAIALSRPQAAARIHMLQPLYVAGRCLSNTADRATVIRLLESIEDELGWSTKYRVEHLLEEWGTDRASILHSCC